MKKLARAACKPPGLCCKLLLEMFSTLALHTLLELHGCDAVLLKNADALRPLLLDAVRSGNGTVVTEIFHNFSPHGVSGVIVISESHVAIHTWPEHGFAAVDIFSCSSALDQVKIEDSIRKALHATHVTRRVFQRGQAIPDSEKASGENSWQRKLPTAH